MPVVKNENHAEVSRAIEEASTKRFDDSMLRVRFSRTRRALRERAERIAVDGQQIIENCALLVDGKPVSAPAPDGSVGVRIDPEKYQDYVKARQALDAETFDLPYSFTLAELDSGKEVIDGKVVPWVPAPWIYDALDPVLEIPTEEPSE